MMYRDEIPMPATDAASDATEAKRGDEVSTEASFTEDPDEHDESTWANQVDEHLSTAARIAGHHGSGLDQFMRAAYGAYLGMHPDVRQQIEDHEMMAHITSMRRAGRVGLA